MTFWRARNSAPRSAKVSFPGKGNSVAHAEHYGNERVGDAFDNNHRDQSEHHALPDTRPRHQLITRQFCQERTLRRGLGSKEESLAFWGVRGLSSTGRTD